MRATCESCSATFETDAASPAKTCARCSRTVVRPSEAATPTLHVSDPRYSPTVVSPAGSHGASVPDAPAAPPDYEIEKFLARGGMGFVVQARDTKLDRRVALKMPLPALADDAEFRERFLREARAAAKLRHPNICPIYEVGESEDGPYIAMAFIRGRNLGAWAVKEKPSARACAETVALLARAVGFAHDNGVVHRDLKPQNVMLDDETGQPVLMDFGLAKETREGDSRVTQSGQIVGTPAYMAPEQAAGRMDRVGPHSDIYSLGAILYELLTGRPPFRGAVGEVIEKVMNAEPVPPRRIVPTLHRDIETICLKAISKDPAKRYANGTELAADLERFAAGDAILARRAGAVERMGRLIRRNRKASVFGVVSVLVVAVAVGYFLRVAATTRRMGKLEHEIQSGIGQAIPTGDALLELELKCAELKRLDGPRGEDARAGLMEALEEVIRANIQKPRLEADDVAAIDAGITLLAMRDQGRAESLREKLLERRNLWDVVFDLSAPFEELGKVMDPRAVDQTPDPPGIRPRHTRNTRYGPLLPTRHPAHGNVQLEARFRDWDKAKVLGLGLGAGSGTGHAVVIRAETVPEGEASPVPTTLGEARRGRGQASLQLWKGETLVREKAVDLSRRGDGEISLRIQHEGMELSVHLGETEEIRHEGLFTPTEKKSGVFEIIGTQDVLVSGIKAHRRAISRAASPLEVADDLYLKRRFEEALAAYGEQELADIDAALVQEIRYKRGLCLLELKRNDEAHSVFEAVAAEGGGRWGLLALFKIWLRLLDEGDLDKADQIIELVEAKGQQDRLVTALTEDERRGVTKAYGARRGGISLYMAWNDDTVVTRLERALKVAKLLAPGSNEVTWSEWNLVRVHHVKGNLTEAERRAREVLKRGAVWGPAFIREFAWLLRLQGRPGEALGFVEKHLLDRNRKPTRNPRLLLERARAYCARERWEEAEADVALLLDTVKPEDMGYHVWGATHLLRGVLAERRGDSETRDAAWREATIGRWDEIRGEKTRQLSGMETILMLTVGSLTGTLTPEHQAILIQMIARGSGAFVPTKGEVKLEGVMQALFNLIPGGLGGLWKGADGVRAVHDLAYLRVPIMQIMEMPIVLVGKKMLLKEGGRPLDDEEQVLLREAMWGTLQAYGSKRVKREQLMLLFGVYMDKFPIGWQAAYRILPADVRPKAAYIYALRQVQQKRWTVAAQVLEQVRKDSPEGSLARRLAARERERIGNPNQN